MNPDNVTECMRCSSPLDQGYSSRYENNECKEVICFKCDKTETLQNYKDTRVLTGRLLTDNYMSLFYTVGTSREPTRLDLQKLEDMEKLAISAEIQLASIKLQAKVKEFERKIWFSGLQDKVLATTCRGVSAKLKSHNELAVLTWTCAGRTMITIEDNTNQQFSAVADETSKEGRSGLQSVTGKLDDLLKMVDLAISLYEDGTLKFEDDKQVGVF